MVVLRTVVPVTIRVLTLGPQFRLSAHQPQEHKPHLRGLEQRWLSMAVGILFHPTLVGDTTQRRTRGVLCQRLVPRSAPLITMLSGPVIQLSFGAATTEPMEPIQSTPVPLTLLLRIVGVLLCRQEHRRPVQAIQPFGRERSCLCGEVGQLTNLLTCSTTGGGIPRRLQRARSAARNSRRT